MPDFCDDHVPGQGFEPQFSDSESDVLPLDDPGLCFSRLLLVSVKIA